MNSDVSGLPRKKEKAGFWCPEDIDVPLRKLVAQKVYDDRSKAIVALLRAALRKEGQFSPTLQTQVEELAAYLQRSPEAIVALCVEGILEMIQAKEPITPVIVAEIGLRRKRGTS